MRNSKATLVPDTSALRKLGSNIFSTVIHCIKSAATGEATTVIKGLAQVPPPEPVFAKRLIDPRCNTTRTNDKMFCVTVRVAQAFVGGRQRNLAIEIMQRRVRLPTARLHVVFRMLPISFISSGRIRASWGNLRGSFCTCFGLVRSKDGLCVRQHRILRSKLAVSLLDTSVI